MKLNKAYSIKNNIIVNILNFIDTGQDKYSEKASEGLSILAKSYGVSLRRQERKQPIKPALIKFILNKEGYIETIPPLYNSICD